MGLANYNYTFFPNSDVDADSPVNDVLMTGKRNNDNFLYESIYGVPGEFTPDLTNIAHDHDGFNSPLTVGELITCGHDSSGVTTATTNLLKSIVVTVPAFSVDPEQLVVVWMPSIRHFDTTPAVSGNATYRAIADATNHDVVHTVTPSQGAFTQSMYYPPVCFSPVAHDTSITLQFFGPNANTVQYLGSSWMIYAFG